MQASSENASVRSSRESFSSTNSDYLDQWLRRLHSRQGAVALDSHESEDMTLAHQHMFLDTHSGPSFSQSTSPASSSGTRASYQSSSSWPHSANSVDHGFQEEQSDEHGFLSADVSEEPLSRTNSIAADCDTDSTPHRTRDDATSTANSMECKHHAGGRIQQPDSDPLIRVEPQTHAKDAISEEECPHCSACPYGEREHRVSSCFICHTTDMAEWIGDPDGLPLCIVCANLYYRHKGTQG